MATPRRPQIEQMLVFDWSELKTRARIALFGPLKALGAAGRGRLRVCPRSAPVAPGLDGADEGLIPLGDLGGALVADLARLGTHRGVRGRLPPAAVLRAPLGRPHRCAARSRSSAIPVYHVVRRATATRAAERPESFAAPRKRSGTLPRTSLSGARSTKTLDMLLLGPSRRPHAPVDWTGRADARTGLDLRPPGPRTLTRPTWPEDAAVATGTIARPPPRLNYVEESLRMLERPIRNCAPFGGDHDELGSPKGLVSPPLLPGGASTSVEAYTCLLYTSPSPRD